MNVEPLLAFIRKPESRGDYDVVWGRIKAQHKPPKNPTEMTIREVLAWQDSIDLLYQSEAAGAYQFMEDTLRDIVTKAGCTLDDRFNEKTQDKLATYLLRRRGLDQYLDGTLSLEDFCNNLAKEWASLPVVTATQGAKRWLKPGQSYYEGDGLNKSHVSVAAFKDAVRSIKEPVVEEVEEEETQVATKKPGTGPLALATRIVLYGLSGHLILDGLVIDAEAQTITLQVDRLAQALFGAGIGGGALGWRHVVKLLGGKL